MAVILVAGDICPINKAQKYFIGSDISFLNNEIKRIIGKTDLFVANLECPLINKKEPIEKTGPVLSVPGDCINGIKELGVDIVNLSNNHIMDHGEIGLKNTVRLLRDNNIQFYGAGDNLQQARRPLFIYKNGTKIGLYGICAHEFSIATEDTPGANGIDMINLFEDIPHLVDNSDYSIVTIHMGLNGFPYPSPRIQRYCRFLIDRGVNCVVCQHSHVAGGYEHYKNGFISYGQGNFIFDVKLRDDIKWSIGYFVRIQIKGDKGNYEVLPFKQFKGEISVELLNGKEKEEFDKRINYYNRVIQDDELLKKEWNKYCEYNKNAYYASMLGINGLLRKVNKRMPMLNYFLTNKRKKVWLNLIRNEDHRELLLNILEDK